MGWDEQVSALELYWIPLGAGAHVVRISGTVYEAVHAAIRRRPRRPLYHSALIADVDGVRTVVEVAPIFNAPPGDRGVVGDGAVGARLLGRWRLFRYEVRRWTGGEIPDLAWAGRPTVVTDEPAVITGVLDDLQRLPLPVWGRDEAGVGDMWNSNSVVSWLLARAGILDRAGAPPSNGRAPGWDAGIALAARTR